MFSIWLNVLPLTLTRYAAQIEETSTFPIWLTIPFLITVAVVLIYGMYRYFKAAEIIVGELEVATIFHRRTGNFEKFLRPGTYWIYPLKYKEGDRIFLGTQNTKGKVEDLRTKEGIPLTIEYNVSFTFEPDKVLKGIEYKMARALPKYAANMISGRMNHVLRHLVEQKSIYELYQEDAVKKLEDEVRAEVIRRSTAIGLNSISGNDMKLGPIHMPPQVEKALKTDYERKLQTATSIEALERLHAVVSKFDDKHMERLAELERLRVVDNNGSLVYLMDSLVKKVRETAVNGNASPN